MDRARFARAWKRHFGDYGDRGGPTEDAAIVSWENMIKNKIIDHIYKLILINILNI